MPEPVPSVTEVSIAGAVPLQIVCAVPIAPAVGILCTFIVFDSTLVKIVPVVVVTFNEIK